MQVHKRPQVSMLLVNERGSGRAAEGFCTSKIRRGFETWAGNCLMTGLRDPSAGAPKLLLVMMQSQQPAKNSGAELAEAGTSCFFKTLGLPNMSYQWLCTAGDNLDNTYCYPEQEPNFIGVAANDIQEIDICHQATQRITLFALIYSLHLLYHLLSSLVAEANVHAAIPALLHLACMRVVCHPTDSWFNAWNVPSCHLVLLGPVISGLFHLF